MVWVFFVALILFILFLDLGVFHRNTRDISIKEALGWTAFWIVCGLIFSVFIYFGYENRWLGLGETLDVISGRSNSGKEALVKYLTGYILEKSLSIDNIFVIAMIFNSFAIPSIYQHRILFWGILGALAMRGTLIAFGASLIVKYHWILYLFGLFLIFTAYKMLREEENTKDIKENLLFRLINRFIKVSSKIEKEYFFVRTPVLMLTPLGVALILVETTDLIFAVDSIPAIFGITSDPFIVYSSNVFAILGMRSLYFALSGFMTSFHYLKLALSIILGIIGLKMLLADILSNYLGEHVDLYVLLIVLFILASGMIASKQQR